MNRQGVLLVCLLVVLAVSVNAEKKIKDSRIVNGHPIPITQAPYIVQLRTTNGFFFCGGSLVSNRHVISAAHCVKNTKPQDIVIVAGATYNNEPGVQRRIIKTSIPQGYDFNDPSSPDDIIVFTLDKPVPTNESIQPIGFCDKPLTPNALVQVSGWGAQYSGGSSSHQLNTVRVPIVDTKSCQQLYSNFARVYGSMFCAANLGSAQDSCQGDSGGPLVMNGKLCGVVSWGRGCARSDSPGVYTSIYAMAGFLKQALSS